MIANLLHKIEIRTKEMSLCLLRNEIVLCILLQLSFKLKDPALFSSLHSVDKFPYLKITSFFAVFQKKARHNRDICDDFSCALF